MLASCLFPFPSPSPSWPLPSGLEPGVPTGTVLPVSWDPRPYRPRVAPPYRPAAVRAGFLGALGHHAGPSQHPPDPCTCRYLTLLPELAHGVDGASGSTPVAQGFRGVLGSSK